MLHMLLTFVVSAAVSDVVWQGGSVTLYANYSYSAIVDSNLALRGGAYAMQCEGNCDARVQAMQIPMPM